MINDFGNLRPSVGEGLSDFDNRINNKKPVKAGKAFFRSVNYDSSRHIFSVYIVWNEVNDFLLDAMPNGGYQIHCSEADAIEICKYYQGIDAYAKLRSISGDLYLKDIYIIFGDRRYVVNFTGCNTIAPEFIPSDISDTKDSSSGSIFDGSFIRGSFDTGSFNVGSFNIGSFNIGSFNIGSFNTGSFTNGSFMKGSYELGSFDTSSFMNNFFMNSSFANSSFVPSSYWPFFNGSYALGSGQSLAYHMYASFNGDMDLMKQSIPYYDFLEDIFGVGFLGYGLDNL